MRSVIRLFHGKKHSGQSVFRDVRRLRFEPLEERALLAVTTADFEAIRAAYPDLGLSSSMNNYNVIEITAEELSESSLRNAITEAGQTTKSDLIVVRTTSESNAVTLTGGSLYMQIDPATRGSVTIVSLGDEKLTIDGMEKSTVIQAAGMTSFGGLIITGGKSGQGAGINFDCFYTGDTLTLDNCIVSNNHVSGNRAGGGIFAGGSGSTIYLSNTIIEGNSAYAGSGVFFQGSAAIYKSMIRNNTGEGINANSSSGMLLLNESQVLSNSGNGVSGRGTTIIAGSVISGNHTSGAGGGIYQFGGSLTVGRDTVISDNFSDNHGGGIYALDAVVNVSETTISNNDAQYGGGISVVNSDLNCLNVTMEWNRASENGGGINISLNREKKVVISNSLIADNVAHIGGGIYQDEGSLDIYNVTIAGNYAYERGGGIAEKAGGGRYFNSIIAKNHAPFDVDYARIPGASGIFLYFQENTLIGISDDFSYMDGSNGCIIGTTNNPVDPMFAWPNDFSWTGPMLYNYRLTLDSPALDAGRDIRALDPQDNLLSVDLDGNERFVRTVDMGAYEVTNRIFSPNNEWIGPEGGSWSDAKNWGYGRIPTIHDAVYIPENTSVFLNMEIFMFDSGIAVKSINCEGALIISAPYYADDWYYSLTTTGEMNVSGMLSLANGNLGVSSQATITGTLHANPGTKLCVDWYDMVVTGTASVDGASLHAEEGATFSLPTLTTYRVIGDSDVTFSAGNRAKLDLSSLQEIVNETDQKIIFNLNSAYGNSGELDISGLSSLSDINLEVVVSQNSLDLSHLKETTLRGVSFYLQDCHAIPGLESFTTIVDSSISIAGGIFAWEGLQLMDNSTITVRVDSYFADPAQVVFPDLVALTDTSIQVSEGSTLTFPLTTNYSVTTNQSMIASGSVIEMPALATISLIGDEAALEIKANSSSSGGTVDMPSLKSIEGGKVALTADGYTSVIYAVSLPKSDSLILNEVNSGKIHLQGNLILISIVKSSVSEEDPDGISFTLTRTGILSEPLVVQTSSSDTNELTVPKTVTFPAGQNSVTFTGYAVQDYIKDGDKTVTITVSAEDHELSSVEITVQDVPPAELGIESLTLFQTEIIAGMVLDVNWVMRNEGQLVNHENWIENIYISHDNEIGDDLLLKTSDPNLTIDPESTLDRSEAVRIPLEFSGEYWIVVEVLYDGETRRQIVGPISVVAPELTLTSETTQVLEGDPDGITFTVARTGNLSEPLVLNVTSNNTAELTVPETVTILAGQSSVTFTGHGVQDYRKDGDQVTEVYVMAEGYSSSSLDVTVIDVPPAELKLDSLHLPDEIIAGSEIDISWIVTNIGQLANHTDWMDYIFLSNDPFFQDDLLLQNEKRLDLLAPGASLDRSMKIKIPDNMAGNYWIVLQTIIDSIGSEIIVGPIDIKAPELTFAVDKDQAEEGINDAFTFTITRNGNITDPLVLNLHCNKTAELELPQTVTIPAGESFVTFTANTLRDGIIDGNQDVRVTVSATGMESRSVFVAVLDVDQIIEPYIKTLDMATTVSQNWTLRQVEDTLKIKDESGATVFEESLDVLLGLVLNASNTAASHLQIDMTQGDFSLKQGVVFSGTSQMCVLTLLGTNDDDLFVIDSDRVYLNELDLSWTNLDTLNLDGGDGTDRLEITNSSDAATFRFKNGLGKLTSSVITNIANTESIRIAATGENASARLIADHDGATFLVDDGSIVMNDHVFDVRLEGFVDIEGVALGTASTTVFGGNASMIVINDRYVERRAMDQFYRVWYSDTVMAIQEPVTASGFLLHWGSHGEDIVESSESLAQITNTTGSYFHRISGFTSMTLPKTSDAQPAPLSEGTSVDLENDLEWLYAFLADEQIRTKRQIDDVFNEDDSDNWLADFEELALLELRK